MTLELLRDFKEHWSNRIKERENDFLKANNPALNYNRAEQCMNLYITMRLNKLNEMLRAEEYSEKELEYASSRGIKRCTLRGGNDGGATYNAFLKIGNDMRNW